MKKNKPKYLKIYYEWMKEERLPHGHGLCREFWDNVNDKPQTFLEMVSPTDRDIKILDNKYSHTEYWGSDSVYRLEGVFTPLRQNLVLLMAALNNEL